jgi:tRNA-2-methylthio-N6-dimethylallyladenosine synthase
MNVSDTELMLGKLTDSGYESVDQPDGADVILINTCAIREHAEQRVIGRLGEIKSKMKHDAVLGVTGCMAQRLGTQLLDRVKHVSLVIGPDGYRELPSLIDSARAGERATAVEFDLEEHYEDFTPRRFDGVKAWIPVQRGCDYKCTYCIVPTTRGPERSRRLSDVVREVESVVASGISEIVLLGQTVNSYFDGQHDFADLLRAVGSVTGVRRLRFTSPHPNDFSDAVIEAIAETPTSRAHDFDQSGQALTGDIVRDCLARGKASGRRSIARRELEGVGVLEIELSDRAQRLLKISFRLSGEANDDIRRQRQARNGSP